MITNNWLGAYYTKFVVLNYEAVVFCVQIIQKIQSKFDHNYIFTLSPTPTLNVYNFLGPIPQVEISLEHQANFNFDLHNIETKILYKSLLAVDDCVGQR